MALGYTMTKHAMNRKTRTATTQYLCGRPIGKAIAASFREGNQRHRTGEKIRKQP